jgi:hypothetical protein
MSIFGGREYASLDLIPKCIRYHNAYSVLDHAIKGRGLSNEELTDKVQRIEGIEEACKRVMKLQIEPAHFSETANNPGAVVLDKMCKNIGIFDVFARINRHIEDTRSIPVSKTYSRDKIDEIMNRRHLVAHTASVLNVSRLDLKMSLEFLGMTTDCLGQLVSKHVDDILSYCESESAPV